jgi:hypothetical protein
MYGSIPEGYHIDHINEFKNDNRLCNLRLVTHTENQHNNSNHLGYTYRKTRDNYYVELGVNGNRVYVGYYDTPEEAHAAYLCAKKEHHPFWVENK